MTHHDDVTKSAALRRDIAQYILRELLRHEKLDHLSALLLVNKSSLSRIHSGQRAPSEELLEKLEILHRRQGTLEKKKVIRTLAALPEAERHLLARKLAGEPLNESELDVLAGWLFENELQQMYETLSSKQKR